MGLLPRLVRLACLALIVAGVLRGSVAEAQGTVEAALIQQMGIIDRVRGVATNVSNYQPTDAEFTYAHALSSRLGGTHAVIDTSRNGVATAGSTWCNPSGQTVGAPTGTYGDGVVDTNLWIKPPGESDGSCNGGPAAGHWWPAAAESLTRDVR